MRSGGSSGFSKYHWYGMLVPLAAALSPMWLSRISIRRLPQPALAVLAGAVVTALAFALFAYVPPFKEGSPLARAVLLGVLVTETMVFHASDRLPSMTALSLFLFLYFFSTEGL